MARDWFDFANAEDRMAVAELAMRGVSPMGKRPDGTWGTDIAAECNGTYEQMMLVAEKKRADKLWPRPCPMARGEGPRRSVASRLPIW